MLIDKPWGSEEILEHNEYYVVKKLYMKTGHRCSLQYHNEKHETFYVLSGQMKFTIGESEDSLSEHILTAGCSYVITPKMIHRMEALENCYYLECSTTQLDDVVRLQDSYGRTPTV